MHSSIVLSPARRSAESYIVKDDALLVNLYNSLASATFKLVARVLTPEGVIRVVQQDLTTASDRTQQQTRIWLPTGEILTLSIQVTAQTPRRGQSWAVIFLESTLPNGVTTLTPLGQGYVTVDSALFWPGGPYTDSVDGPGALLSVAGTNPAAGIEVIEAVPTNARWQLRSFRAVLVTSATVSTRTVNLIIDDGTTTLLYFNGITTQAASLTQNYQAASYGSQPTSVAPEVFFRLPFNVMLLQGGRIRTSTTNLQTGDNWGAPQMDVEEWIEN